MTFYLMWAQFWSKTQSQNYESTIAFLWLQREPYSSDPLWPWLNGGARKKYSLKSPSSCEKKVLIKNEQSWAWWTWEYEAQESKFKTCLGHRVSSKPVWVTSLDCLRAVKISIRCSRYLNGGASKNLACLGSTFHKSINQYKQINIHEIGVSFVFRLESHICKYYNLKNLHCKTNI